MTLLSCRSFWSARLGSDDEREWRSRLIYLAVLALASILLCM